jgi:predicted glycoside hydrolase/deacetylase ChbG (UPF0249 family)
MCHPGYFDVDLAHSRYGRQRETEAAALTDPRVQEAVRAAGVDLINYGTLMGSGG